jgi:cytoskeletal protein CcmA (bactofilin family)
MLKREKKFESGAFTDGGKAFDEKKPVPSSSPLSKDEKTVIGEQIFIEGSIRGEEHLVVEGSMKGTIEMEKHNFSVGPKGRFEGEIKAQNVSIGGQMIGKIKSQGRVEITKEADFLGEIKAKSISVEDGAYFKGTIELDREPHRKSTLTGKTSETPAPAWEKPPMVQTDKSGKGS